MAAHLHHDVQFYESPSHLAETVRRFVDEGLAENQAVLLIVAPAHLDEIRARIGTRKDAGAALDRGQLAFHDAEQLLREFMPGPRPDPVLFRRTIIPLIEAAAARFQGVRVFGEMVNLLWERGDSRSTLELEDLWNELRRSHPFRLLCGYRLGNFLHLTAVPPADILRTHEQVLPPEVFPENPGASALETKIETRVEDASARAATRTFRVPLLELLSELRSWIGECRSAPFESVPKGELGERLGDLEARLRLLDGRLAGLDEEPPDESRP